MKNLKSNHYQIFLFIMMLFGSVAFVFSVKNARKDCAERKEKCNKLDGVFINGICYNKNFVYKI